MEQKRPADIFQELPDYLWNGLGLEEKGWKRLKKGDFKKKMKNGLTYQIWFDRSRYNYIDYEIGHGNVEMSDPMQGRNKCGGKWCWREW